MNDSLKHGHPAIPLTSREEIIPAPEGPVIQGSSRRPSWDDVWSRMADTMSERSKCSRAQIGCVIVAEDQTVISTGYNGPPAKYWSVPIDGHRGCENWCERARQGHTDSAYSTCPSNHAEANAIVRADWSRLNNATTYVTGSVCFTCAKLLASAGIKRVVHRVHDSDAHRDPEKVEGFLRKCGVKVVRI